MNETNVLLELARMQHALDAAQSAVPSILTAVAAFIGGIGVLVGALGRSLHAMRSGNSVPSALIEGTNAPAPSPAWLPVPLPNASSLPGAPIVPPGALKLALLGVGAALALSTLPGCISAPVPATISQTNAVSSTVTQIISPGSNHIGGGFGTNSIGFYSALGNGQVVTVYQFGTNTPVVSTVTVPGKTNAFRIHLPFNPVGVIQGLVATGGF
jgi:hypothetical protein